MFKDLETNTLTNQTCNSKLENVTTTKKPQQFSVFSETEKGHHMLIAIVYTANQSESVQKIVNWGMFLFMLLFLSIFFYQGHSNGYFG